jgi:hypothetical protein
MHWEDLRPRRTVDSCTQEAGAGKGIQNKTVTIEVVVLQADLRGRIVEPDACLYTLHSGQ